MKATFVRIIEADDKASALRELVAAPGSLHRFEVEPVSFRVVPRAPFAYWVSPKLRQLFTDHPPFAADGRVAASGGKTLDDFRWIRASWEVPLVAATRWVGFAKGGAFSPYYADVHLLLDWRQDARALKEYLVTYRSTRGWSPNWTAELHSAEHYLRPGLTWPRRTTSGLSLRVMPAECIFGDKGPALFVPDDDPHVLLAILAVLNSQAFHSLVELQLAAADAAARSYEVGVLQRTPIPRLSSTAQNELTTLARTAWSTKRSLDTCVERSHAMVLPALLQVQGTALSDRAEAWVTRVKSAEDDLARIQRSIDELCFELYGIGEQDRRQIETGFDSGAGVADSEDDDEEVEPEEVDIGALVESLLSWSLGVAVGRFDPRLATGVHDPPPEPEPFAPLPSRSPGMPTGEDGLPLNGPPPGYPVDFPRDGILVDDAGHDRDLVARMRQVFELVFGDEADAVWRESSEILEARKQDLRAWVGRSFFEGHVKDYSKSRRKAPIYWQLSTPSASYSVWLYLHRFTRDTLYKVLNDFVEPKLRHEERKLASLTQEAAGTPTSSQRKEIHVQTGFVEELRSFRDEVARIAPLWNPTLDDGVIINFAPLWRLVPQNRSWQKECKKVWDKLCKGEYDWAHLAMHLWPERVVPKCHKDRSLAIAHGLEDVFWEEDTDGKWKSREVDPATVDGLIAEHTSAAVRGARQSLLDAPVPTRGGSKSRGRRARKGRRPQEPSKGAET